MRATQRILIAVVTLMLCTSPLAAADQGKGGGNDGPDIVPVTKIHGDTSGDLLGDWFAQNLALDAKSSPFGNTANLCLDLGHHGRVLSPAGGIGANNKIEMSCTVQVGRPVLLVASSADCSSAEEDPFFGTTEAEQRACALNVFDTLFKVTSISVSIDGADPVEIHKPKFFAVSPQRRTVFSNDPVFPPSRPGPATFVAVAWIAEISGMRPGHHVLVDTTQAVGFDTTTFTVHFDVVDRGHHDD